MIKHEWYLDGTISLIFWGLIEVAWDNKGEFVFQIGEFFFVIDSKHNQYEKWFVLIICEHILIDTYENPDDRTKSDLR